MIPSGIQCFCNDNYFPADIELKQHLKDKHLLPTFRCKSVSAFEKECEIPANPDFHDHVRRLELAKRMCIEIMDSDQKSTDLSTDHIRRYTRLIQKEINTLKLNNTFSWYSHDPAEIENPEFLNFLGLDTTDINNIVVIAYSGNSMQCTTTDPSSDIDLQVIIKKPETEENCYDFDLNAKKLPKQYRPEFDSTKNYRFAENDENHINFSTCSLPAFIWQCLNSDSISLNLLHAGDEMILHEGPDGFFSELKKHKHTFYSKNLPYIGFAKHLIGKTKAITPEGSPIGIDQKDKLHDLIKILNRQWSYNIEHALKDIHGFDELIIREQDGSQNYSIAGLEFSAKTKTKRVIKPLENQLAKIKGEVIDNKNPSIIARLITQSKEIFTNGDFEYPLPDSSLMINLIDRCKDEDTKKIDEMIIDFLSQHKEWPEKSGLAESVDRGFWKNWLQEKGIVRLV